jgi:DNA repair protein RadC
MIISVEGALPCRQIRGPEDVGDELIDLFGAFPQEAVIAISLGPGGRVLGLDVVALGSSWRACIEVRDVFTSVCRREGTGVIVAHNHPSGLTSPSEADLEFSCRLLEAGELLGIEVVDHLIVTTRSWRSLKESTRLWAQSEKSSID